MNIGKGIPDLMPMIIQRTSVLREHQLWTAPSDILFFLLHLKFSAFMWKETFFLEGVSNSLPGWILDGSRAVFARSLSRRGSGREEGKVNSGLDRKYWRWPLIRTTCANRTLEFLILDTFFPALDLLASSVCYSKRLHYSFLMEFSCCKAANSIHDASCRVTASDVVTYLTFYHIITTEGSVR